MKRSNLGGHWKKARRKLTVRVRANVAANELAKTTMSKCRAGSYGMLLEAHGIVAPRPTSSVSAQPRSLPYRCRRTLR